MRIGFDSKRAFNNTRGLGNYSRTLIQGLYYYYPKNDYLLYTSTQKPNFGSLWDIDIYNSNIQIIEPGNKLINRVFHPFWRSFLDTAKDQLDIYHGLSHEIPLSKRNKNTRYITTIHDLIFLKFPEYFSWFDRSVYQSKIKYSCNNSDKIIAISRQTKADLVNYFGVKEEKIEVIYQACSPEFYNQLPDGKKVIDRFRYNLPEDFILYVGAVEPHKNLSNLIKALKYLPANDRIPLVIIGKGRKHQKEIDLLVQKYKLNSEVIFVDYVARADIVSFFQMAKILVWPSLYEGFGLPIVEALFCKTPVITSKRGCFSEAGGQGAVYINPESPEEIAHAVTTLCGNEALKENLVREGYLYVQQFHQETTTKKLMDFYVSLL